MYSVGHTSWLFPAQDSRTEALKMNHLFTVLDMLCLEEPTGFNTVSFIHECLSNTFLKQKCGVFARNEKTL